MKANSRPSLRQFTLLFVVFLTLAVRDARSAAYYFSFDGGKQYGHQFSIIDSTGKVAYLGIASGAYTSSQWMSYSGQTEWNPDWWTPEWSGYDPAEWYATGSWRIDTTTFSGNFNEQPLTLTADTLYYLYDYDLNQYSDPFSASYNVWEGTSLCFYVESVTMHDGWPSLPVQTIGGGLKVFGVADFRGKTRFNAPVRIAPAGDLSMGEFTHEPPF